jgi:hypothetical protein
MRAFRPALAMLFIAPLLLAGPNPVSAQVPATEAQEFLGAWDAEMQTAQGTFDFELFLRDQGGVLAGEVTSPQGDTNAIEQFVLTGTELIIAYSVNFGGQRSDIRMTLAPNDTGLAVILEMPGFTADGLAERMEEEPAQAPQ